jgi:hypothetical protein
MGSKEHFQLLEKEKASAEAAEVLDIQKVKDEAIINSEKHLKRISNNVAFFFWLAIASIIVSFIGGVFDFLL